jgi:hypothetical protein
MARTGPFLLLLLLLLLLGGRPFTTVGPLLLPILLLLLLPVAVVVPSFWLRPQEARVGRRKDAMVLTATRRPMVALVCAR